MPRFLVRLTSSQRFLVLLLFGFVFAAFGAFWNRDVTAGDTAGYHALASYWARKGQFSSPGVMTLSPLYLVFYAWVQRFFLDAMLASAVHHVLIVLGTAWAVFAGARRLLPRAWAWLVAAWWAGLHWNAFYAVHQFSFGLIMLGAFFAGGRSAWSRGAAIAVLLLDALLVRNELLPCAALFALLCLFAQRGEGSPPHGWRGWGALAAPSLVAVLLAAALFSSNPQQLKLSKFREGFAGRNRVNFRQVFAFGYLQRRADWQGNPWTESGALMQRLFGQPEPTMAEALRSNPRAALDHLLWNFRLLPAGLQVGLFGDYSEGPSPDYSLRAHRTVPLPLVLTAVAVGLWTGGFALLRQWRRRHGRLFRRRAGALWTWLYLACVLPASLVAIATQRPRVSYIFPLVLCLMVWTALSLRLVLRMAQRRWHAPPRLMPWLPFGLAAGLLVLFAEPLPSAKARHPLADDYHRLAGLRQTSGRSGRVICANNDRIKETLNFLRNGRAAPWKLVYWAALGQVATGEELRAALERQGVTDLYLCADGAPPPTGGGETPGRLELGSGWHLVAEVTDAEAPWQYWVREEQ